MIKGRRRLGPVQAEVYWTLVERGSIRLGEGVQPHLPSTVRDALVSLIKHGAVTATFRPVRGWMPKTRRESTLQEQARRANRRK